MVFEWQGEGSREVNGPPDVCPRPFARNQDRVRATTWRTAARWLKLVGQLLETKPFRDARVVAPAWWGGDPDFAPMKRPGFRRTGDRLRSPSPDDCRSLISLLGEPWERIEPRINQFIQRHRHFLGAAGDSQFFVRAIHALGTALIGPGGDQPHDRAAKAQALALKVGGALEAAELVGWEAIRRDPDDVDARNQLATLLAGTLGRPSEAEALLRDTIAAFPRDVVGRCQLAEVLIAADRLTEAEAIVDAAFRANVLDGATFALRARLQSHRGQATEAAATLREGLIRFPSSTALHEYERILAAGRPLSVRPVSHDFEPLPAPLPQSVPTDDPALADASRNGRVRRLRFRSESQDPPVRDAALADITTILRDDPTFAYAELLAARHGLWQAEANTLPSFAAAFEQALAEGDRARLEELAKRQPRLEALTLLARAVLGDEQAAWLVDRFLRAEPASEEARSVMVLRQGLQPYLAEPDQEPIRDWLTRHRDTALRVLHDANEAGLADRLLAA
jgi:tetratricopeptide (TPR) repeat protein